ncbi:30S ribosomal protein S7 (mitochondrion) [Nitzschia inconspicua]|uniref:30S ribosomal protein S7 n=1 Tax=Nitzschia inconspicua TaxID=303405 RepID=A0A8H2SIJ5_9STRA|nr:30S ribosomal protein S7 [Nitzschia inconspicua]
MIEQKENNLIIIKNKIVNSLMKNGKKRTGEKILLKLSKSLQRSTRKNSQTIIQLAIINLTPAFKINEQIVKKGKRKSKKIILSFIVKNSLRVMNALKSINFIAKKDKSPNGFSKRLCEEILDASAFRGLSVEQKTKLQDQILLNKRYLSNFRW